MPPPVPFARTETPSISISCGGIGTEAATMRSNVAGSASATARSVRAVNATPNPNVSSGTDRSLTRTLASGIRSLISRAANRPAGPPPMTSTRRSCMEAR
jgi:hypothetical protein